MCKAGNRQTLRWIGTAFFAACIALLIVKPVLAENYAFLVAVQDYDVKDLKKLNYTRNDIEQFALLLKKSGFKHENIVLMSDSTPNRRFIAEADKIRQQFSLLLATLRESDTLIVAFSGHGVQFEKEAKSYYCPADADLSDPKREKLIAISEIYERLKECPASRKLLLVDACRNDPLSEIGRARQTVQLKSVTRPQTEAVPKGVVALFSCSAGQQSYEWPELKHGVFFYHVLQALQGDAADGDRQVTLNGLVAHVTAKTQSFARVNLNTLQSPQLISEFAGTWVLRKVENSRVTTDSTGETTGSTSISSTPTNSSVPGAHSGSRPVPGRPYSLRVDEQVFPADQAAIDSPLRAHRDQPWVKLVSAELEKADHRHVPMPFSRDGDRIILVFESSENLDTHPMMSHARALVLLKNERGETTESTFTTMSRGRNKSSMVIVDGGGYGAMGAHFGGPLGRSRRGGTFGRGLNGGAKSFTPNMEIFVVLEDQFDPQELKRFKISNSLSIGGKRGLTLARDWRDDEVKQIDESVRTKTGNTPKEAAAAALAVAKVAAEALGGAAPANVERTASVGESGGVPYEFAKEATPMLGLAYAFGQWDVHRCIGRIRPVFKDVLVPGYSDRVMAKPGYAVGGINLEASPYFAGFQIIFMRLDGKRLKPNDSYTSDWIRAGTEKPTESATYRSDGKLVIGIHGYAGAITNTMGLIYQLEGNERPSVASPADGSQPANTGIDRAKTNILGSSGPVSKGNQKAKGDVMVQWGGTWFSATILKTENGKSLVHYDDWGSNWDEWVTPNRIKKK